jgi:SET domain-containing protein
MSFQIQNSTIAGVGVYATSAISAGTIICIMSGEHIDFDEAVNRVKNGIEMESDPLATSMSTYIDLDETSRSFNHSCEPNAYIRSVNELVALKDILPDDEICFDYSTTMHYPEERILSAGFELWTCACQCGTASCRGIIDQFKTLPIKKRAYYLDHKYLPDFMIELFKPTIQTV